MGIGEGSQYYNVYSSVMYTCSYTCMLTVTIHPGTLHFALYNFTNKICQGNFFWTLMLLVLIFKAVACIF